MNTFFYIVVDCYCMIMILYEVDLRVYQGNSVRKSCCEYGLGEMNIDDRVFQE